eukprot:COSAG02_NODE_5367_length_4395_cov_5.334963_6_plen_180_part_01
MVARLAFLVLVMLHTAHAQCESRFFRLLVYETTANDGRGSCTVQFSLSGPAAPAPSSRYEAPTVSASTTQSNAQPGTNNWHGNVEANFAQPSLYWKDWCSGVGPTPWSPTWIQLSFDQSVQVNSYTVGSTRSDYSNGLAWWDLQRKLDDGSWETIDTQNFGRTSAWGSTLRTSSRFSIPT